MLMRRGTHSPQLPGLLDREGLRWPSHLDAACSSAVRCSACHALPCRPVSIATKTYCKLWAVIFRHVAFFSVCAMRACECAGVSVCACMFACVGKRVRACVP